MQSSFLSKHPYLSLGWIIFICLAVSVASELPQIFFMDQNILNDISRFQTPQRTAFFRVIALTGSPAITFLIEILLVILLWQRKHVSAALIALTMAIGGNAAGVLIKFLVHRPRPTSFISAASGYSFPSSHVIGCTILTIIIFKFGIQLIPAIRTQISIEMLILFWLVLVALSRLYLQAHYPSDVLGGGLFALIWCQTVLVAFRQERVKITNLIKSKGGS